MPTKLYRKILPPPKPPTREELNIYMARIATLGQVDHYRFSSGLRSMLVTGVIFLLVAGGLFLWAAGI